MKLRILSKFSHLIVFLLVLSFLLIQPGFYIQADEDLDSLCQLDEIEKRCEGLSDDECRELLERCASYLQEKSDSIEQDIDKTEQEKKTLQNQIYILNNKIKQLNYQIYQNNLMIKDLGLQIGDTEDSIEKTSLRIDESKAQLSKILRELYEQDQRSTVEILLGEEELSDFFDNLVALESLNSKNRELLESIKGLKNYLQEQRQSLDSEKQELESMVKIQELQKQESAQTKQEKNYFLALTEEEYQKYVREKQEVEATASEIRSRIFDLIGVPEAPTFGEAYEMAKQVESLTGVRSEFLLAVLTQESNIGKNVGQCYLKDPDTGDGVVAYNGKVVSRVMKPSRDVGYFIQITEELGRDPYNTPVSCPMSYGWGGAMGPAQFIPATWIAYRDRLKEILGRPADPWNIKDAFLAAAVYLSDNGATKQTYNDEFNAALSYFAGPGWYNSSYRNIYKRDYGYPIMNLTERYEAEIKVLEGN
jgi:peptidoglycan hydrolase CwlO-like protein